MSNRVAILMPDFKGQSFSSSGDEKPFVRRILEICNRHPEFTLVPLLNGAPEENLKEVLRAWQGSPVRANIEPRICTEVGVAKVVQAGYSWVVREERFDFLIRIDSAEHPPEAIFRMLWMLQTYPAVVGTLTFKEGMLGKNEQASERQMLQWCERYMRNYAPIGHAHGLQGYRMNNEFGLIRERAMKILTLAEAKLGKPLLWGGDLATLLAADGLYWPGLGSIPVTAEKHRDRGDAKNEEQFKAWEAVWLAAYELNGPHKN